MLPFAATRSKSKGKQVDPSERAPLLPASGDQYGSASTTRAVAQNARDAHGTLSSQPPPESPPELTAAIRNNRNRDGHRSARSYSCYTLIALFTAVFLLLAAFAILFASYIPSETQRADLPKSFKYKDPTLDVLNVSDAGVHVRVSFRGGVDVDRALSLAHSPANTTWYARLWGNLRRVVAHGAVGSLPTPEVAVAVPMLLVCACGGGLPLMNVSLPDPVGVPLLTDEPLVPVQVEAVAQLMAPVGDLWKWSQEAWAKGQAEVVMFVPELHATVPGWMGKFVKVDQNDVSVPISLDIPHLPNFPPPGTPLNISELVHLDSYSFSSEPSTGLSLTASASIPNPGVSTVPYALPFEIKLEDTTISQVVATATDVSNTTISVSITGQVDIAAMSREKGPLSHFLQRFLHGQDNPVTVRGLQAMPRRSVAAAPPDWLLRSLPSLSLQLAFPAPNPRPKIIREVKIEDMRLFQVGTQMHVSGVVMANICLPDGMENVALNVTSILPDVLVYDGPVEDGGSDEDDKQSDRDSDGDASIKTGHVTSDANPIFHLPHTPTSGNDTEPPPRAFGRIHPDDYIPSTTLPSPDPDAPNARVVRAPFDDIWLEILPGRNSVLQSFVAKVVFKGGAMAGLDGDADVYAAIEGVGGKLEVNDLPVRGEFWVKR